MDEFVYAGDFTWEDGWIYDPNNGNTYSCEMTLIDQKNSKLGVILALLYMAEQKFGPAITQHYITLIG